MVDASEFFLVGGVLLDQLLYMGLQQGERSAYLMCCFGHQVLCALQGIIQTINKGVEGFDEVFHLDGGMDTYGLKIGMGAPIERLLDGNQGSEGMADTQINHEQGQNDERGNGDQALPEQLLAEALTCVQCFSNMHGDPTGLLARTGDKASQSSYSYRCVQKIEGGKLGFCSLGKG